MRISMTVKKTNEMKNKIILQQTFNATWYFEKEFYNLRYRGPNKYEERTKLLLKDYYLLISRIKKTNSMSELLMWKNR